MTSIMVKYLRSPFRVFFFNHLELSKFYVMENRTGKIEHQNGSLLHSKPGMSPKAGSPEILFDTQFSYEAIELTSSFCGSLYNSGNVEKLQQAVREKNIWYLRQISQTVQNLDAVDGNGFAPLHHASSRNDVEMISVLLDCDANINCRGHQLLTPLHVAVR